METTMTELAVRAALLGDSSTLPAGGHNHSTIELATNRELTDASTHAAVADVIGAHTQEWKRSVLRALRAGNLALLEAMVFDAFGGYPTDEAIEQLPVEPVDPDYSWEQVAHTMRTEIPLLHGTIHRGRTTETLTAIAAFEPTSNAEYTLAAQDPREPHFNRMNSRWRLGWLAIARQEVLSTVGLKTTNVTIKRTRAFYEGKGLQEDDGNLGDIAVGVNIYSAELGRGRRHHGYRHSPRYGGDADILDRTTQITAQRLVLNELRTLVPTGAATQSILDGSLPLQHQQTEIVEAKSAANKPGLFTRLKARIHAATAP